MIQYDKTYSEDIGLLKMDFLGLRNLSVIQDALGQIKKNHGLDLDPLQLPEGDTKTLALLGKGATVGVFQFESGGMQDYLRKLKPTCLEDMIAMNALYRPGPMEFIGQFIARKHGHEKVDCYHVDLEPILKETYGVIVYQEQVMQIAQVLSGFSLGGADLLRRAMAKKDLKKMDQLKPKFVDGAKQRGYDPSLAERIWEVLVPFSSYAFNKSHSAAYATIAYQTAYLKANYPAEFMAANMNSEMHDTSRLTVLLGDCRSMGIEVDFPDINRSEAHFAASKKGRIVYGLAGIKNVGLAAVQSLVKERSENGGYQSLADLCKRVDGHLLNRRALEALIYAGALPDEIPGNRAQQFAAVEQTMAFAQGMQADAALGQVSLFDGGGESGEGLDAGEPPLPDVDPWPYNEMLEKEKEVLGLYLSGHPLESYRPELEAFASASLDPERLRTLPAGQSFILGGMITKIKTRLSAKDNKAFAFAQLEDFLGKVEVNLWSDLFEDVRHLVELDSKVLIRGTLKYNEDMQLFKLTAEKVLPLDEARDRLTRSVHIRMRTLGLEEEYVDQVMELCQAYEGSVPLVLHLDRPGQDPMTVLSEAVRVSPEREFTDKLSEILGKGQCWLSSQAA
jgi:DNA polymerase-3 subunit alpha